MNIITTTKNLVAKVVSKYDSGNRVLVGDNEARGGEAIIMAERLRSRALDYRANLEKEWNESDNEYVGNHWPQQRYGSMFQDRQENTRVYQSTGGDDSDNDLVHVTLNRTLNSILSNAEAQITTPPAITVEAEESGEPAEHWLSMDGAKSIVQMRLAFQAQIGKIKAAVGANPDPAQPDAAMASAQQVQVMQQQMESIPDLGDRFDEQYGMNAPLTKVEAGMCLDLIDMGMLAESDLKTVNDAETAKCAKSVLDRMMRESRLEHMYQRDTIKRTCRGTSCMSVTYHMSGPKRHRFTLVSEDMHTLWADPEHETIEELDYLGEDRTLTLDRAKAEYPDVPAEMWEEIVSLSDGLTDTYYADDMPSDDRDTVSFSIIWIRNHLVPCTTAQAVGWGWVEAEAVTVDEPIGDEVLEFDGQPVQSRQVPLIDEETGQQKKVYRLTARGVREFGAGMEGEEVEPQQDIDYSGNWPKTYGLRQMLWVHGMQEPLVDVRCPYLDIPKMWAVNVPRLDGSPYGLGDAKRLQGVQHEINRILSVIINRARYSQSPMVYLPQSLFEMLEQQGFVPYMTVGGYMPVPDATFNSIIQNGGFSSGIASPPPTPPDLYKTLELLLREHDNLSGNVGVRQGRAPFAGASGEAIAQLKEEAMGTLSLKARHGEYALQRGGEIMLDAIVQWLPETEWQKICSGWELPALRSIIARCERLKMNVKVAISSGRGVQKDIDKQNALGLYDRKLLSAEDTLRTIEVDDVDGVLRRRAAEMQAANPAPAPAPAQVNQTAG